MVWASASTRSRRIVPSRPSISAVHTASSISRSATVSIPACAASSSRRSTSRCRSTGTSAWAGASVADELGEFIEILPPQKRVGEHWYLGTADAVYQNLYSIQRESPRHVIVLSGDHVYKMDYAKMLRFHRERGAAATLATIEVPVPEEAAGSACSQVDEREQRHRISKRSRAPARSRQPELALASMGIYIFDTDVLVQALEADARSRHAVTTSARTSSRG